MIHILMHFIFPSRKILNTNEILLRLLNYFLFTLSSSLYHFPQLSGIISARTEFLHSACWQRMLRIIVLHRESFKTSTKMQIFSLFKITSLTDNLFPRAISAYSKHICSSKQHCNQIHSSMAELGNTVGGSTFKQYTFQDLV